MSPEDGFRRVLAARLPAGPGWTAWIDGTVAELAAAESGGITLAGEDRAALWRVVTAMTEMDRLGMPHSDNEWAHRVKARLDGQAS